MAMSTDVNLPRGHEAKFPDRCVVCGTDRPDSHVRLFTGTIGWWSWLLWFFRKPVAVRAPACTFCAWRLHVIRLLSLTLTILLVALAFWLAWDYVHTALPRGLRKWAMLGIAALCLLPQVLYETLFPHPFNITAFDDSIDYEFRDPQLAQEFAELNADAAQVTIAAP